MNIRLNGAPGTLLYDPSEMDRYPIKKKEEMVEGAICDLQFFERGYMGNADGTRQPFKNSRIAEISSSVSRKGNVKPFFHIWRFHCFAGT
ncbi:hypothetical protein [Niabella drilacis]|uniref:Uncharacterized protein n=1 Tax=Niabella drilacis (strain DSM 25811 / CCM 8410 / CCUG 62505 / LMG 26954 / E90) TaxID=1285928 RepID=A0A1G6MZE1_NIADE|nr:hypothetical protein [Niabella drilacis]SDC60912.1 hypothetical protein SAMN04487894_10394 [Niabella drilacis]